MTWPTTKDALEVQDGDNLCNASVADTGFTIVPPKRTLGGWGFSIMRDGAIDEEITRRALVRFGHDRPCAASLRRIAGWLREGAPE